VHDSSFTLSALNVSSDDDENFRKPKGLLL
jgi:hypothetical protein